MPTGPGQVFIAFCGLATRLLAASAQRRYGSGMSFNKFPPKPKYDPDTGPVYLYGLHTVRAALDNKNRVKKVLLATPNALMRLQETGEIGKVTVKETTVGDPPKLTAKDPN